MFEKITDNVEIHQTLPDTPNMTTQELKVTWDKGCKIIKEAFNKLIDKLNDAKITSTVLYENTTGTTGEVTLLESASNFDYLEIYYYRASTLVNVNDFSKISNPEGKAVALNLTYSADNSAEMGSIQHYTKMITVSGKSIKTIRESQLTIYNNASFAIASSENIYITKVIGYK